MTVSIGTAARSAPVSADWRLVSLPLAMGLLLLGALFNKEVVAALDTWTASTAYNHCFLVIPITLYLLWDRRFDLNGIAARPLPAALLGGLPLAACWLVSERLGIMEGRQLVAISFVQLLFLAVLGKRLWWAMAGPLLYLYFLVPFGEFLTPKLQDVTMFFIRNGLQILGVPAYIDGYVIEIPQGTFFVAEACAGLRFLIASIAFGWLYALMMYRSPMRRGVFIVISMIVPVIANGFRGIGIVYLGYVLGSAEAAAADHVIYGWVFFSAVILVLIALGLPFRQDEMSTRADLPANPLAAAPDFGLRGGFVLALGVAVVAAISPMAAAAMGMAASAVATPVRIEVGQGCQVRAAAPAAGSGSAVMTQRVRCGDVPMDMTWESFSPRSTAGPVMAERRRLVARALSDGLSQTWLAAADGAPTTWRILSSNDPAYITAVAVWIDGKPARPGLAMRLRMAIDSLTGSAHAPMIVTVTPVVEWKTRNIEDLRAAEAGLPHFLLTHPELNPTVGALSVQP